MLDALRVADSPAQLVAVIRFKIPQMELPSVMGSAVEELLAAIQTQGITRTAPLFNRYLSMDGGMFDFEVGVPVSASVAPTGRVLPGQLPAAKVVRTTYHGPYSGLHHAWREFADLGRAQGYVPAGGIWESYVVGPETNPDPATWRTELNQPLLDREIVSSRVIGKPRVAVFGAFSDPSILAKWWGPNGFTNTIEEFDLRPGGTWRLVMRGPDGTDYHNVSGFVEVVPAERIVYNHLQPIHGFRMTTTYADEGEGTRLTWRMRFDDADEAEKVRRFVTEANEQNFDRLQAALGT